VGFTGAGAALSRVLQGLMAEHEGRREVADRCPHESPLCALAAPDTDHRTVTLLARAKKTDEEKACAKHDECVWFRDWRIADPLAEVERIDQRIDLRSKGKYRIDEGVGRHMGSQFGRGRARIGKHENRIDVIRSKRNADSAAEAITEVTGHLT